jgi:hypothetical protein
MDLVSFHKDWLGRDPERTPKDFRVTPQQVCLYEAFPKAKGFSSDEHEFGLFLGVFILALAQTKCQSAQPVYLVTSKVHADWVVAQMQTIARYMVRTRKNLPNGVGLVQDVLGQVFLNLRPIQTPVEPARWVAFGLRKEAPLPTWIVNGLIDVPNDNLQTHLSKDLR